MNLLAHSPLRPSIPSLSHPLTAVNRAVEWSFRSRLRKVERLPIPVISVGNLTSGGTGKTPVVQWLAEQLCKWGYRPAIALRGYGGTISPKNAMVSDGERIHMTAQEGGDEALVHAQRLPRVPVLIGRDRVLSGRTAMELGSDVLLLDDGFQYWRLHRDLDIVLVDARWLQGERGSRHFPRERLSSLQRAHVVAISKAASLNEEQSRETLESLRRFTGDGTITCECNTATEGMFDARSGCVWLAKAGDCAVAFSAIADNDSFFAGLRDQHIETAQTVGFADHHVYCADDIARLNRLADQSQASFFITTEKDAVKLNAANFVRPLVALRISAHLAPENEVLRVLRRCLSLH